MLIFDRGCKDYEWFHALTVERVHFVTRRKENACFVVVESRSIADGSSVRADEIIVFTRQAAEDEDRFFFFRRVVWWDEEGEREFVYLTNPLDLRAATVAAINKARWQVGVSRQGHIVQAVRDRPRLTDSGLVAWEAPWRENKTVEPRGNMLKEDARRTRLPWKVNAYVASLDELPVAETVHNARKRKELIERGPARQILPAEKYPSRRCRLKPGIGNAGIGISVADRVIVLRMGVAAQRAQRKGHGLVSNTARLGEAGARLQRRPAICGNRGGGSIKWRSRN